jgi:hypothetical protein
LITARTRRLAPGRWWTASAGRIRRGLRSAAPVLALVFAFAFVVACKEEAPKRGEAQPSDERTLAARALADERLRDRLRPAGELRLRGVQIFAQAVSGTLAVCGRVSASTAPGDPYLPYVAVVSFDSGTARLVDLVLGATGAEASRVFVEMVDRCFDGGGPPLARASARASPPLPSTETAHPSLAGEPPASPPSPRATEAAPIAEAAEPILRSGTPSGMIVVTSARSPANIRSSPQGGTVLRTVPRATSLDVFGEAPGGWVQVGSGSEIWGWIHTSLLDHIER